MTEVVLQEVAKHYGNTVAVANMTLRVADGELVALLGPSGCGKTTTLRMIGGFVDTTSGRITVGGRDVTGLPPNRRNMGFVFQNYALFPHMTVAQNVAFGLEMRQVNRTDTARKVREVLARVRLGQLADRLPRQLSGGQQQRVALARALVIEPDVLLLDEPLSNLDASLRQEMKIEIRQLQQSLGLTTVFVTHDQDEAMSTADRMVLMYNGKVEQVGPPDEVYGQPRSALSYARKLVTA
ncbi:MAG: ABC transporter ATP-binding protein [Pseudorhodobacter sp.]